jgi:hypothetical protein
MTYKLDQNRQNAIAFYDLDQRLRIRVERILRRLNGMNGSFDADAG